MLKLWQLSFHSSFVPRQGFSFLNSTRFMPPSPSPRQTCARGTLLLLERKKEEGRKHRYGALRLVIAYRGRVLHEVSDNTCNKNKNA